MPGSLGNVTRSMSGSLSIAKIVSRMMRSLSWSCDDERAQWRDFERRAMELSHYRALAQAVRFPLSPDLQARVSLLGRLLTPRRALGVQKLRLGGEGDGGYVMLNDFAGVSTAFSLGVGSNVDWDHEIAERGIEVWQFDHTVVGPPRQHRLFRFNKRRIDGTASAEADNLASLLAKHGSPTAFGNLLKVDIEGSEWGLFRNADVAVLDAFPQIVCELHGLADVHDDNQYRCMTDALTRLRGSFEVVHVHGNNVGGRVFVSDQALPNVVEVTLAHRGRYVFDDEVGTFPTLLDRPCDPNVPDYELGTFAFDGGARTGLQSLANRTQGDAMFEPAAYRAANPDLDVSGGEAWTHWRLWGWREGRPIAPNECGFDPDSYLAANPDVAAAGFDALTHWRHFGRREGRRRSAQEDLRAVASQAYDHSSSMPAQPPGHEK